MTEQFDAGIVGALFGLKGLVRELVLLCGRYEDIDQQVIEWYILAL